MKRFSAQTAFENGQHRDVVSKIRTPGKTGTETMALIGSLSFLGRVEEASELFSVRLRALSHKERSRARFAIAVAYTRISKFKSARKWLKANLDEPASATFADAYQGLAVYHYYLGNFQKAADAAKKALSLAIKNGDSYIHAFAIDLYGHALVQTGRRSQGIQKLVEARQLSGRTDANDPFSTAKLVYEAEAGHRPTTIMSELEAAIELSGHDDSYTRSNLTLELARQLTLRGQWSKSRQLLDAISPTVYRFQNRRHEALLQMRLAELSYRQNDGASALHFIQAAHRCLLRIADRAFEVRVLGLEAKIERRLFAREPDATLLNRLKELSESNPRSMGARILARASKTELKMRSGEDPLGDLLDRAARDPKRYIRDLIEQGYLGLWPEASGWRGEATLAILEDGHWLAVSADGVRYSSASLTPLTTKLLRELSKGTRTKADLVRAAWGYEYDPLRHDPMIYTALATLRRTLESVGHWVETQDEGWALRDRGARVTFADSGARVLELIENDATDVDDIDIPDEQLNWRQVRVIASAGKSDALTVHAYRKQFTVSTMTAWRDLDGLTKRGFLKRIGQGRATAYLPQKLKESL